ncbi:hypothetical protein GOP47_0023634 [Adiantum capillus-veneris]|uniref:Uncharacterized protein n=1 Tax=Adiantum capillus-veneris TaxID=13818 RepID=A0A9D4U3T4_ADICA|nr:hypothetical protein GOP47_0023634 [Adiantum capillus-veneris]
MHCEHRPYIGFLKYEVADLAFGRSFFLISCWLSINCENLKMILACEGMEVSSPPMFTLQARAGTLMLCRRPKLVWMPSFFALTRQQQIAMKFAADTMT